MLKTRNLKFRIVIWKYIIFSSLIILLSCGGNRNSDQITVIDIGSNVNNWQNVSLSSFTTDITYIPLQIFENNFLVGNWQGAFSGDYFLASTMTSCLLYRKDGSFVTKIGNIGNGPGEYGGVFSSGFGPDKTIYIQSRKDLFVYNYDGTFIEKFVNGFQNEEIRNSWIALNDTLIFSRVPNRNGNEEFKAVIHTKYGRVKEAYTNYIIAPKEKITTFARNFSLVFNFKKQYYFKEMYNDTLFRLNGEFNLKPAYIFKLGKYGEPYGSFPNPNYLDYYYMHNIILTDSYVFIDLNYNKDFPGKRLTPKEIMPGLTTEYNTTQTLGIYDITLKELKFCMPTGTDNPLFTSGLYNDIDGGPRFFPKVIVNDNTLAM